jgi:protein-S-isoprenylcysteine O-methyltransferase Ste14
LLYIGIGIATASWVILLCAILWIGLLHFVLQSEERFLLEKYGDSYREYMNKTPKWIGFPKSGEK